MLILSYELPHINRFCLIKKHSIKALILLLGILCLFVSPIWAQLEVHPPNAYNRTIESLIRDNFKGSGVTIESIKLIGSEESIAEFRQASNDIGIEEGIVLTTGLTRFIAGPNTTESLSHTPSTNLTTGDPDLQALANTSIKEVTGIELTLKAQQPILEFKYVFASEEYPEYTCSRFNDIFGFFVSGPNPDGGQYDKKNIALVPDPSDPSGNTFTDLPVWTNSVNNGQRGSDPSVTGDCSGIEESLNYSQYYNDNTNGQFLEYDGFLDVFKARIPVVPCRTYTVKIIIGDSSDAAYDSAIFLEKGSLKSRNYEISVDYGAQYNLQEGCAAKQIRIDFDNPVETATTIPLSFAHAGVHVAQLDSDFEVSRQHFSLNPGEQSDVITLTAREDNITEPLEYIYIWDESHGCGLDTLVIPVEDNPLQTYLSDLRDTIYCSGAQLSYPRTEERLQFYSDFNPTPVGNIREDATFIPLEITDHDILWTDNQQAAIQLEGLSHEAAEELRFYLRAPWNETIQLPLDIRGNIFGTNHNIAIEDMPAGIGHSIIGTWQLIVEDIGKNSRTGSIDRFSISIQNPEHFDIQITDGNGRPWDSDQLLTQSTSFEVEASTAWGCTFDKSFSVQILDHIEPPSDVVCSTERHSIEFSWSHSDPLANFEVNINNNSEWISIGSQSTYTVDNLAPDEEVNIRVRTIAGNCHSEFASQRCKTTACTSPEIVILDSIPATNACMPNGLVRFDIINSSGDITYFLNGERLEENEARNLAKGSYTLSAIDQYGCESQAYLFELGGVEELTVNLESLGDECAHQKTIVADVQGGTPPYQLSWAHTTADDLELTITEGGTYQLTVTDAAGCQAQNNIEITQTTPPRPDRIEVVPPSCTNSSDGTIRASYNDINNNITVSLLSPTNNRRHSFDNLYRGTYRIVATHVESQCQWDTIINLQSPNRLSAIINTNPSRCNQEASGTAIVQVQGGTPPYSVQWLDGTQSTTRQNLIAGQYPLIITDNNGCMYRDTAIIDQTYELAFYPTLQHNQCAGGQNGSITLDTDPQWNVVWSDGATGNTRSELPAGQYQVALIAPNGCQIDTSIEILDGPTINPIVQLPEHICPEEQDIAISLTLFEEDSRNYNLETNTGVVTGQDKTFTISNLNAGEELNLILRSNEGCTWDSTIILAIEERPELTFDVQHVSCHDGNDGEIRLITNPLEIPAVEMSWEVDGQRINSTAGVSNLQQGSFAVEITDHTTGCKYEEFFEINQPDSPLSATASAHDISCTGQEDGSVIISAEGGEAPYQFRLSNGQETSNGDFQGLASGTYRATITDNRGCQTSIAPQTIMQPDSLSVQIIGDTTSTELQDLPLRAEIEGGHGDYFIFWFTNPQQQLSCTQCIDPIIQAINQNTQVTLEVEDSNGCLATASHSITINRPNHLSVPTAFSPNGDGLNDRLYLYGTRGARVTAFQVFAPNGTQVYQAPREIIVNLEDEGWDGTYQGNLLPPVHYLWSASVQFTDGNTGNYSGRVLLLR